MTKVTGTKLDYETYQLLKLTCKELDVTISTYLSELIKFIFKYNSILLDFHNYLIKKKEIKNLGREIR